MLETGQWDLTVRREAEGAVLVRARTRDARAAVPETAEGLPVAAIGPRALAAEGKDNARLTELTLPSSVRRVGDYALYNCRALGRLRVPDAPIRWGDGVLTNCRDLRRVDLFQDHGDQGTLHYFAGELNRAWEAVVYRGGEVAYRLTFPEYREVYQENTPAHHFDYTIQGAGYPYRRCFRQRRLDWRTYDACWTPYMEPSTALRLAWWRLRYPEGLADAAPYRDYLCARAGDAIAWLIQRRDVSGLAFLLDWANPDRDALGEAAALARTRGETAALALLLEEQRWRFPVRETFVL